MTDDKEARSAKPGSLLSQWWTMGTITSDRRAVGRHAKVAWVIIDRYMSKHGKGQASVRFIESQTGLSKSIILKACRELVEWGYLEQRVGVGTRPTEYIPSWAGVSPMSNAGATAASVPQESNASVAQGSNSSGASVPPLCNESYLPLTGLKPGLEVGNVSAVPSAPPADGHSATAAGPAGFERVWAAYGKHGSKTKARAAFNAITEPDVDHIVARAASWAASAKPGQRRMPLEKWLAEERFDEADRQVVRPAKSAMSKVVAPAAPALYRATPVEKPGRRWTPVAAAWSGPGAQRVEAVAAQISKVGPISELRLEICYAGTMRVVGSLAITLEATSPVDVGAGRAAFDEVMRSMGIMGPIDETDDLLLRPFCITDRGEILVGLPNDADASQKEAA